MSLNGGCDCATDYVKEDAADSDLLFDGGISRVWVKDIFITDTI